MTTHKKHKAKFYLSLKINWPALAEQTKNFLQVENKSNIVRAFTALMMWIKFCITCVCLSAKLNCLGQMLVKLPFNSPHNEEWLKKERRKLERVIFKFFWLDVLLQTFMASFYTMVESARKAVRGLQHARATSVLWVEKYRRLKKRKKEKHITLCFHKSSRSWNSIFYYLMFAANTAKT